MMQYTQYISTKPIQNKNKKVLLHKRKRHTACRVASACYAGQRGVPHPVMVGGTPSSHGHSDLARGVPWVPPHHIDLAGVHPTIQTWLGYPPPPSRPGRGVPQVPPHHSDLAGVPPPSRPGWGTHPLSRPGCSTHPPSRPGQGSPPPHHQDLARVPPLPSRPG